MHLRKFIFFTLFFASITLGQQPEDLEIFVLVGQSNMAGRGKLLEADAVPIGNVFLFNDKQQWETALPPFNRYAQQKKKIYTGMNPGVGFVANWRSKSPLGIVCQARGGTSIEQWLAKDSPLYTAAVTEAKAAEKSGRIAAILWHQGESNAGRAEQYPLQLRELVRRFRNDLGNDKLPFVFGQLGSWNEKYASFNAMIVEQPEAIPFTACVRTAGLTGKDSAHFDRASQLELGKRYAEVLRTLLPRSF